MKTNTFRLRNSGFTLIELLVVIAIIAILAAILFPVFAQARAKARQAACLSNTKQIGLGVMQYYQDYDETYPVNNFSYRAANPSNVVNSFLISWAFHIEPYIKNTDVFACPSRVNDRFVGQPLNGPIPATAGLNYNGRLVRHPERGIGANEWVVGRVGYNAHNTGTELQPLSDAEVRRPADTPFGADSIWVVFNSPRYVAAAGFPGEDWAAFPNTNAGALDPNMARHNGGANIVYCDGHSKWSQQRNIAVVGTRNSPDPAHWWTSFALPLDARNDTRLNQ